MATITEIVQLSLDGQPLAVANQVDEILAKKIHDVLELRKQNIARQIFGNDAVDTAMLAPSVMAHDIGVNSENVEENKSETENLDESTLKKNAYTCKHCNKKVMDVVGHDSTRTMHMYDNHKEMGKNLSDKKHHWTISNLTNHFNEEIENTNEV